MSSGNFPTYLKLSPERISCSLAKLIHHVNKKLTIPSASSSVKQKVGKSIGGPVGEYSNSVILPALQLGQGETSYGVSNLLGRKKYGSKSNSQIPTAYCEPILPARKYTSQRNMSTLDPDSDAYMSATVTRLSNFPGSNLSNQTIYQNQAIEDISIHVIDQSPAHKQVQ